MSRRTFVGKIIPLFLICCLSWSNFSSKEQVSFNFTAAVTTWSDFGASKNKICHCFPIYLPWSDGTRCHDLRRNGVAIIVNKRVWNAVVGCSLKNDRMISVLFQGKPFNITVIQIYAPISNAEEAEVEQFYQDLLELTPKKDILFFIRDWNAKVKANLTLEYRMKQNKG